MPKKTMARCPARSSYDSPAIAAETTHAGAAVALSNVAATVEGRPRQRDEKRRPERANSGHESHRECRSTRRNPRVLSPIRQSNLWWRSFARMNRHRKKHAGEVADDDVVAAAVAEAGVCRCHLVLVAGLLEHMKRKTSVKEKK